MQSTLYRVLPFVHSTIIQHVEHSCWTVMESVILGFLTIICPKIRFCGRKNWLKIIWVHISGSPCHTQTETNGNAPCSLISLLYLQYASHDKLHGYVQISSDNSIIILKILANNNAEKVDKYPSNVQIIKANYCLRATLHMCHYN